MTAAVTSQKLALHHERLSIPKQVQFVRFAAPWLPATVASICRVARDAVTAQRKRNYAECYTIKGVKAALLEALPLMKNHYALLHPEASFPLPTEQECTALAEFIALELPNRPDTACLFSLEKLRATVIRNAGRVWAVWTAQHFGAGDNGSCVYYTVPAWHYKTPDGVKKREKLNAATMRREEAETEEDEVACDHMRDRIDVCYELRNEPAVARTQFAAEYAIVPNTCDFVFIDEFCDAGTLERVRKQYVAQGTNASRALLMSQICETVEALHKRKIIHRDLHTANIMFKSDPNGFRLLGKEDSPVKVKLIDLELFHRLEDPEGIADGVAEVPFGDNGYCTVEPYEKTLANENEKPDEDGCVPFDMTFGYDMWQLGYWLRYLYVNQDPLSSHTKKQRLRHIASEQRKWEARGIPDHDAPTSLSHLDLFDRMMHPNPLLRISARQAKLYSIRLAQKHSQ